MNDARGYSVADFRDRDAEVTRLEAQSAVIARAELEGLIALGLPESGRVLDLGCGPGFVAAKLRAARPGLDIVGVDADPTVLALAEKVMPVTHAEAAALPFDDASFDVVLSRLVVRHLPDPLAALREARRVLRPGGSVIVTDTDDGTLVLDPEPDGFARARAARHETYRRRAADPFIARRLPGYFVGAGLSDVRSRPLHVFSGEVGADVFAAIVLAPLVDAIDLDLMSRHEAEAVAASTREWSKRSDAFGITTAFQIGGTKRG